MLGHHVALWGAPKGRLEAETKRPQDMRTSTAHNMWPGSPPDLMQRPEA